MVLAAHYNIAYFVRIKIIFYHYRVSVMFSGRGPVSVGTMMLKFLRIFEEYQIVSLVGGK